MKTSFFFHTDSSVDKTVAPPLFAGNIHVYTNQGAAYSQFYQPRRRRAYERREEAAAAEENPSQVRVRKSSDGPD